MDSRGAAAYGMGSPLVAAGAAVCVGAWKGVEPAAGSATDHGAGGTASWVCIALVCSSTAVLSSWTPGAAAGGGCVRASMAALTPGDVARAAGVESAVSLPALAASGLLLLAAAEVRARAGCRLLLTAGPLLSRAKREAPAPAGGGAGLGAEVEVEGVWSGLWVGCSAWWAAAMAAAMGPVPLAACVSGTEEDLG